MFCSYMLFVLLLHNNSWTGWTSISLYLPYAGLWEAGAHPSIHCSHYNVNTLPRVKRKKMDLAQNVTIRVSELLVCWNAELVLLYVSLLFISACKCLKSQWASDMDLATTIARDIVGAAVDLESVSEIIKHTLNLSACTENDLWMNFKRHASFCNLPNERWGFDLRSDTQYRAKRFFYF